MHNFLIYFIIAIFSLIWAYYKSVNNIFKQRGIAHDIPLPIIGNLLPTITEKLGVRQVVERLYWKYTDEKVVGFFSLFQKPSLIIRDPELIKKITIKDFNYFVNRDNFHGVNRDKFFDISVFALQDEKWKEVRSLLSPMFSSSKMKYIFELMTESVDVFIKVYDSKVKENMGKIEIDTSEVFGRITSDTIATTCLGLQGDCVQNEDSGMFKISEQIAEDFAKGSIQMVYPKIFSFFGIQLFRRTVHDFFETTVTEQIKQRKEKGILRTDIIQLMLQAKEGRVLTDHEMIAQSFVFFLAGFDTTTALMQAISFELALNFEIQQNLINEIDEMVCKLEGRKISYELLNELKYLEMVILEGLRKWPPARFHYRSSNKDYDLVDDETGRIFKIEKDTKIFYHAGAIQRDPKFFPNPEKFDPLRFIDGDKNLQFFAFGSGPRTCIGSRFAMIESKLLLFNIMKKFSFIKCSRTPDDLTITKGSIGFDGKIFVGLKLRE